jgi:hypothetical protein
MSRIPPSDLGRMLMLTLQSVSVERDETPPARPAQAIRRAPIAPTACRGAAADSRRRTVRGVCRAAPFDGVSRLACAGSRRF